MSTTDEGVDEARRLAVLLIQVAEQAKRDFARVVEPFGIPVPMARALLLLDEPAPMRAVADQLACDQSYVTGLADDLEERGLVTREPGQDRRVKVLTPTKAGITLRTRLARAITQNSPAMTRLDAKERATLRRLLSTLHDA